MNTPISQLKRVRGPLLALSHPARKVIFITIAALCVAPFVSPAVALILGIAMAQFVGHPYIKLNHKATHWLLQASVVGLGFGMNIHQALETGKTGLIFTLVSITSTLLLGYGLGRCLKIYEKTSFLIACGTAICGGSAIAAISPVIKAEEKQISVALGCVFVLNSIALLIFPAIGQYFHLSQSQFGLWCAIAIHDTSSVVGAASKYGVQALQVATTVKLSRALWIIPVAFLSAYVFKNQSRKIHIPYFILLFVLAMFAGTYMSAVKVISPYIIALAKAGLTLTLFLIGAGLSMDTLAGVGVKPFLQGVMLWVFISVAALIAILHFVA